MSDSVSLIDAFLGLHLEPRELTFAQMSARALVVFAATLVMLRLAHKRFFAQRNALDVLLTLVIASTLSRAINGSAPFFPTIAVGFVIIVLHRAVSWSAARNRWVGRMVKGTPTLLIEDGAVKTATLRRHDLSQDDLDEDLRLKGITTPEAIRRATLERNGEVSVIK